MSFVTPFCVFYYCFIKLNSFASRTLAIAALVLLAAIPSKAHAACASPTGEAGSMIYNADHNMMQFCDGTNWIGMGANLAAETDPEVGTLTSGKWCTTDGTDIDCTSDAPGGTPAGADTQIQFNSGGSAFGADANLVWNNTNKRLGIGTATPDEILHIDTNTAKLKITSFIPQIMLDDDSSGGSDQFSIAAVPTQTGGDYEFVMDNDDGLSSASVMVFDGATGNVGIGTATPTAQLHVSAGDSGHPSGAGVAQDEIEVESSGDAGITIFSGNANLGTLMFGDANSNGQGGLRYDHSSNNIYLMNNGVLGLTMNASGNVGIGTTSPSTNLDVNGSIELSNKLGFNNDSTNYSISGITNGLEYKSYSVGQFTFASGSGNWSFTNGNVGIGTTSPGSRLHVENAGTGQIRTRHTGATAGQFWKTGMGGAGGSYIVYNQSDSGVYLPNGSTSWLANSDRRLKENIKPYRVLDKLDAFRAVSFDWKGSGRHEVGVIAQELEKSFPEIVTQGSKDAAPPPEMGSSEAWGVAYDRLGAISLQGVKEIHSLVLELKADNEGLRELVEELGREIEALKAGQ